MYTHILIPLCRRSWRRTLPYCQRRKADQSHDTALFDSAAGRVCDLVVTEETNWHAELIVIGTHGRRGVGRVFMGSDAEQIVRHAPTPVLLVRSDEATQLAPAQAETQTR